MKNLINSETREKEPTREGTKPDPATLKGKLLEFLWTLKKEGIKENTARNYAYYLENLASHGANLLDPESVKETIACKAWSKKSKALAVSAYTRFLKSIGGHWNPPRYRAERKLPYIPSEKELDSLISAGNKKMSAFLQLLKETGMRAGEAWSLRWIDIDLERNLITLNKPEKGGRSRMFKISPALTAMLNNLPKKAETVFTGTLIGMGKTYRRFRKRVAHKLQNPKLLRITFHTFRHWMATMEYHRTKDILHVMERLGHKSINTTLLYTQLVNFESDYFHSATAKTVEEAKKLIETGFEYVCDIKDVKLFRKRK
jgi:integrase